MRLTALLLFATILGSYANTGYAQKISLTAKEKTVGEVINQIERTTDFRFIGNIKDVDLLRQVSFSFTEAPVENVLFYLFRDSKTHFKIRDHQVILNKEDPPAGFLSTLFKDQEYISGVVTDRDEVPMLGVTVRIANSNIGTSTNMDGYYRLNATSRDTLVFSYIGYETRKIAVGNQQEIYVQLTPKSNDLNEVVVIGYGTQKRKDLTGSVGSVRASEIQQIKGQTLDQALVGRIAGVHVSAQMGGPGSGAIVHVRGLSQLIGDNQPLYVVDGVPIVINPRFSTNNNIVDSRPNPLLAINPADIERIDVLKDASSAAIYGSRAANGVVLITTKRGNRNQVPRLNFSYSTTVQSPVDTYDVLNATQYKQYIRDQGMEDEIVFGDADTDWQDAVTNHNPLWNQYNLSLSGGSDNINYLVSGHIDDQKGLMLGTEFNRYSFSTSVDADLTERLRLGSNFSYNHTLNKRSGLSSLADGAFYRPDRGIFNEDGTYTSVEYSGVAFRNPLGDAAKVDNEGVSQNILGSIYGEYKILEDLKVRSQLSLNLNNGRRSTFHPSFSRRGLADGALLDVQHSSGISTSWSNTLNYHKTIGGDHTIDALIGASWDHSKIDLEAQHYVGFPDDEVLTNINSANSFRSATSAASETALNSLFGRFNYNYKNRYLATFTARSDGSIKFGPNRRRGFFPSGALAWNIHQEDFFSGFDFINRLKLRASLGRTGSDNLPAFTYLVNYTTLNGGSSYYDGVNGIAVNGVPNSDIRWEQTDQLDLGLEFGLFQGRLNAEIVYFEKKTSDIILLVPIPSQTGYTSWNANIADVSNTGVEINIGGDLIRKMDFRWNSSFNISFINNNVEALNGGATTNYGSAGIIEGQPIGVITGYKVAGIAQTDEEIEALNTAAPSNVYYSGLTQPGDYIYEDVDGDGEITNKDVVPIGDINPEFYGGWNNSLSYKNFDFSFNFNFVQGNQRNWTRGATEFLGVSTESNVTTTVFDTWTPDNPDAKYARIGSATHGNNTSTTRNVVDGSYIKLRSASLSYNFPRKWLKETGFENVKLTLSGNNLMTISDYPGLDPESVETQRGGSTVDLRRDTGVAYPMTRTFTMGVAINL